MVAHRLRRLEVEDSLNLIEEVAACDLSMDLEVAVDPDALELDLDLDDLEVEPLDLDDLDAHIGGEESARLAWLAEMQAAE